MNFVPARHYRVGRTKAIRLIVIHCTVSREMGTGAEAVAEYFRTTTRKASAHRTADDNSTVMSVHDTDTAFAAAGANADGLHLELVGLPQQSETEWLDAYSRAELAQAGTTIRQWATKYAIPHRWLTVDQVADGQTKGFCTHADVSRAFPDVSTGHWDPGPNFPKAYAMRVWFPSPIPIPIPIPQEPDDMAVPYFIKKKSAAETFFVEEKRYTHVKSGADLTELAKAARTSTDVAELSDGTFNALTQDRTLYT